MMLLPGASHSGIPNGCDISPATMATGLAAGATGQKTMLLQWSPLAPLSARTPPPAPPAPPPFTPAQMPPMPPAEEDAAESAPQEEAPGLPAPRGGEEPERDYFNVISRSKFRNTFVPRKKRKT